MGSRGFIPGLFANRFLPSYFQKKGENLATKEDLGELTEIAESIKVEHQLLLERTKPFTAEETLRREVFFNSKLEAFYSALDIVCRRFAANEMQIHDANETHDAANVEAPSESEVNLAYGRMAMFATYGLRLLPVSPCKVRQECRRIPGPTPDFPMNTGRMS